MRNRKGFVAKSSAVQPDYYKNVGGAWCAVFITDDDLELHLQMVADWFDDSIATGVELLIQKPSCRDYIYPKPFKTIKSATRYLEKMINVHKKGVNCNAV